MAGRTQPTYFNAADHTVISYRDADASVERPISADLATILFEDAPPARSVPSWKGKNVYEGDYWAATTRGFVPTPYSSAPLRSGQFAHSDWAEKR